MSINEAFVFLQKCENRFIRNTIDFWSNALLFQTPQLSLPRRQPTNCSEASRSCRTKRCRPSEPKQTPHQVVVARRQGPATATSEPSPLPRLIPLLTTTLSMKWALIWFINSSNREGRSKYRSRIEHLSRSNKSKVGNTQNQNKVVFWEIFRFSLIFVKIILKVELCKVFIPHYITPSFSKLAKAHIPRWGVALWRPPRGNSSSRYASGNNSLSKVHQNEFRYFKDEDERDLWWNFAKWNENFCAPLISIVHCLLYFSLFFIPVIMPYFFTN